MIPLLFGEKTRLKGFADRKELETWSTSRRALANDMQIVRQKQGNKKKVKTKQPNQCMHQKCRMKRYGTGCPEDGPILQHSSESRVKDMGLNASRQSQ